MRKLGYLIAILASALAVAFASTAGAKTPHRVLRCKPGNSSTICVPPRTSLGPLVVTCHQPNMPVTLPKITITANAGIREITVKLDGRTVKTYRFKHGGPTEKVIRGLTLKLAGLKAGVHKITVTTVDSLGKRSSTTRHIAICKPVPKFTG